MERHLVLPALPGPDMEHRPGHPGSHPGSGLRNAIPSQSPCPPGAQQPDSNRGISGHIGFPSMARRRRQGPGSLHQRQNEQPPWAQHRGRHRFRG
eukprot:7317085-Pyramimonas_sp.AAC.1